jgi:hypothetical protein
MLRTNNPDRLESNVLESHTCLSSQRRAPGAVYTILENYRLMLILATTTPHSHNRRQPQAAVDSEMWT